MIIKFKNGERWEIFGEVDHCSYGEHFPLSAKEMEESDILDFTEEGNDSQRIDLSFFTKNMTAATNVIAHSPIYLMNDNGRTVETIFGKTVDRYDPITREDEIASLRMLLKAAKFDYEQAIKGRSEAIAKI